MSTDTPQLPAFLIEPLACPPGRCRYPGRPLPPISTQLETLLYRYFYDAYEEACTAPTGQGQEERHQYVETLVLTLADNFRPEEMLPILATQQAKMQAESPSQEPPDRPGMEDREQLLFVGLVADLVSAVASDFSAVNRQYCLHDLLDPARYKVWERHAAELRAYRTAGLIEAAANQFSTESILERLRTAIAGGKIDASYGGVETWERKMREVIAKSRELVQTAQFDSAFPAFKRYYRVLERPGCIIGILSQCLGEESCHDVDSFRQFWDDSPQLAQFIHFLLLPTAIQDALLSSAPTPPVSIAALDPNPLAPSASSETLPPPPILPAASTPPPTHSSTPSQSQSPFDRFQRLDNIDDSPHIHQFVTPRFCPVDQCSGRSPIYDNFASVDKSLRILFSIRLQIVSIATIDSTLRKTRMSCLTACLPSLAPLNDATLEETERLVILAREKMADYLTAEYTMEVMRVPGSVAIALRYISEELASINRKTLKAEGHPCFCSLSHLTDELDSLCTTLLEDYDETIRKGLERSLKLPSEDLKALRVEVRRNAIAAGIRWGENETRRMDKLIDFFGRFVADYMINNHNRFTPQLRQVSLVISSARILEETNAVPLTSSNTGRLESELTPYYLLIPLGKVSSSEVEKEKGDDAMIKRTSTNMPNTPTVASVRYQLATLIDPSNFRARLNSAAARLAVADHQREYFQFSRTVYDCSAALYYGSTSYKAYYRRGYALTHLKMWKEAVLDFEQALLVEPNDPLLKYCLSAAKRRTAL